MSKEYEPVKWVNGLGKVSWQPQTLSGERLYRSGGSLTPKWLRGHPSHGYIVVYRSKARAIRVARRKDRQDARVNWSEA